MKDEEWETRLKLGNQFRGLHEDEFQFLTAEERKKQDKEKAWREEEKRELMEYRQCVFASIPTLQTQALSSAVGDSTPPGYDSELTPDNSQRRRPRSKRPRSPLSAPARQRAVPPRPRRPGRRSRPRRSRRTCGV